MRTFAQATGFAAVAWPRRWRLTHDALSVAPLLSYEITVANLDRKNGALGNRREHSENSFCLSGTTGKPRPHTTPSHPHPRLSCFSHNVRWPTIDVRMPRVQRPLCVIDWIRRACVVDARVQRQFRLEPHVWPFRDTFRHNIDSAHLGSPERRPPRGAPEAVETRYAG